MSSPFKTGLDRSQASLLPARVDDYVDADNPVRAIEAFVGSLNLAALGFGHAERTGGAGQPPYHPADLLKLYIYGYTNQVRSSRRLEREAGRNLELIWLLRGLVPSYRTLAAFRADNAAALRQTCRSFVVLLRSLDLVGGEVVAIDGAFFDGSASKASIVTRKRLDDELAAAEREIAAWDAQLDANDAAEAHSGSPVAGLPGRLQAVLARRAAAEAGLAQLDASGQTQLSRTDADARLLTKGGQSVAGYNVQIAVDGKHKLIVASEVVNDGNDTGQLHAMACAAQEAVGSGTLTVVADSGYHNGATLRDCEADGIEAFVPEPTRGRARDGRFGLEAFGYDAETDQYECPHGRRLRPMPGLKCDATGKRRRSYASRRSECRACPLREQCLGPKGDRRVIARWEHEAVLERHRARMTQAGPHGGAAMMRQRKALVEHPFGTLKCRAGYRHFLVRGFKKVRGEWGLMALCYNLTRLLSILGLPGLMAALFPRGLDWVVTPLWQACAALKRCESQTGQISSRLRRIVGKLRKLLQLTHTYA